jgi:hypothetical protein
MDGQEQRLMPVAISWRGHKETICQFKKKGYQHDILQRALLAW